ncbi:MAG TPA: PQQ-binding-like beta-propeller repeat protein [Vicinamibacteria bacterium]|nr:PQQ-binding-like beta-propeller repeat protein [Vicinamibacteria bacterium]
MAQESLADHLRRATRNFTTRFPEDRVFALGHALALDLARAHGEQPPRHPEIDPALVEMVDGAPRLTTGTAVGDVAEDLFRLGCLLSALALGEPAALSWRLDGPPPVEASTVRRRAVLATLAAPRRIDRHASALDAARELQAASGPMASAGGWPLFRGDAGRSGWRPLAAAARVRVLWRAAVGPVAASPVLTPDLVLVPAADGRLLFIDRERGRLLHVVPLGPSESSPALSGGVLHVGTDDGTLVGIDVQTGAERYRARLGGLVRSSPLPVGDRVLVGVVDAKGGGALAAVDARGKTAWARKTGAVFSSPALGGGRVVCGSDDGALTAVDPATGALAWSAALGAKVRATPAVAGELAVVGTFDGLVKAVRLADGTVAWSAPLGHAVYSSACIAGAQVVVGCHEGHLHGLDLATGRASFETATGGPVVSSPVAAGPVVLAPSTDGRLYLLDASGAVLSRELVAPGGIQSSPALDGADVALGSAEGVHLLRVEP